MEATIAPAVRSTGAADVRRSEQDTPDAGGAPAPAADPTDEFVKQASSMVNDPDQLTALVKSLTYQRLYANYTRRIEIAKEATKLDAAIAHDEKIMAALDGTATAAPASGGKAAGILDKVVALLPVVQSAVNSNPAVAQLMGLLDERTGGLLSQVLATPEKQG